MFLLVEVSLCRASEHFAPNLDKRRLMLGFTKKVPGKQGEYQDKRVLVGSSGFTTNVMQELNYENFISIDQDALFDYFLQHHLRSFEPQYGRTLPLSL